MADLLPFKLTTDGLRTHLEVNGTDITDRVESVAFAAGHGQVAQLQLTAYAEGALEGIAQVVEVRQAEPDGEAIASWLSAMDAETLEKTVTASLGWGGPSYTQALLDHLAKLAAGG